VAGDRPNLLLAADARWTHARAFPIGLATDAPEYRDERGELSLRVEIGEPPMSAAAAEGSG